MPLPQQMLACCTIFICILTFLNSPPPAPDVQSQTIPLLIRLHLITAHTKQLWCPILNITCTWTETRAQVLHDQFPPDALFVYMFPEEAMNVPTWPLEKFTASLKNNSQCDFYAENVYTQNSCYTTPSKQHLLALICQNSTCRTPVHKHFMT